MAEVVTSGLSIRALHERRVGDTVFERLATASGLLIVLAIVLIAVFLLARRYRRWPRTR